MKNILLVVALIVTGATVKAQQLNITDTYKLNKDYLQKSRQQKTLGTVSVISGGALALTGGYLWFLAPIAGLSESGDVEGAERTGKTLVIVGSSLVAISIPLFIASKNNREKASLEVGTSKHFHPSKGNANQLTLGISFPLN